MAMQSNIQKQAPKPADTPIYFEVLAEHKTTEAKLREETKALDPQDWTKAVEAQ